MPQKSLKTKILILGPVKGGKTAISNYLADSAEVIGKDYRPTQGVRIVEFESNELELDGERVDAEVELWDCSGDRKFESCWPAIRHGTNGAILVVNPEQATGEQLLLWYNEFVQKIGLRQEHVLVLLHHTSEQTNDSAIADFKLPSQMQGIVCIPSNIDREGEALRLEFNNFLCNVITDTKGRETDCAKRTALLLLNKTEQNSIQTPKTSPVYESFMNVL
uniref:Rab-like protein 5 n=1 Tax=Acrobeloides nanus TaxID=290746 RepID=A0A914DL51_9BILA